MLRIGQIIQSVDAQQGGTSAAFVEVLEALRTQRDRLQVTAFAPEPPKGDPVLERVESASGVDWRLTGPAGGFRPAALAQAVISELQSGALDVVQLHGVWSSDLVAIADVCASKGVPYLWTPHGMLMDYAYSHKRLKKALFMRMGLAKALRRASAMVFACEGERNISVLPNGVDRSASEIVGLPVDLSNAEGDLKALREAGRARFGLTADEPALVFIGRLHPVKRLELTLDALAMAGATTPGLRLLLLGDGDATYVESLKEHARSAGVEERVIFGGWVGGDDKWSGLAAGDALVINSKHENFGYAIIEALGVDTPVLMTEHLSMAPDVVEAGAGVVVPNSAASLAKGMHRILTGNESKAMAQRGRAWVMRSFSREAVGQQLAEAYDRARAGSAIHA